MTWIKICGTTNLEDALMAVDAGANAVGFVFYENSPRYVDMSTARDIIAKLPSEIEKVGVVPTDSTVRFREIVDGCGLTGIQLHVQLADAATAQRAAAWNSPTKKIYLSFSASDLLGEDPQVRFDFSTFEKMILSGFDHQNSFGAIMVDSGNARNPGGTGQPFDWKSAQSLVNIVRRNVNVVVAGGLNPGNVSDAIRILNPWGVDVVSGVEAIPGKKDKNKVRAFVRAVRNSVTIH